MQSLDIHWQCTSFTLNTFNASHKHHKHIPKLPNPHIPNQYPPNAFKLKLLLNPYNITPFASGTIATSHRLGRITAQLRCTCCPPETVAITEVVFVWCSFSVSLITFASNISLERVGKLWRFQLYFIALVCYSSFQIASSHIGCSC
jgi:hypothetical protein